MTSLGLPFVDAELESRVRAGLRDVECRLGEAVASDAPFVAEASRQLMSAGGKRFRPMLVLVSAEFGDPDAFGVVTSAVGVELTHLATLYHDDVMDQADLRRGTKTANAQWDNSVAILTGDFLFAQASKVIADLGPDAVRIQSETFARLVEGQIRETVGPRPGDDPLQHYLRVVADKTGSLISTSARYGAMMAGAGRDLELVLTEFGERIGTAFQLSDDVIDVASETGESGKTPGTDLREGVPTLPVLIARTSQDPADARLLELLDGDLADDDRHAEALALLRAHPAMRRARTEVSRYSEEARKLLEELPGGAAREALAGLCDLVVTRTT